LIPSNCWKDEEPEGVYGYITAMDIKIANARSKFQEKIRISRKNNAWIKKHKVTKTNAGMLDIIINFYKKYGNVSVQDLQNK